MRWRASCNHFFFLASLFDDCFLPLPLLLLLEHQTDRGAGKWWQSIQPTTITHLKNSEECAIISSLLFYFSWMWLRHILFASSSFHVCRVPLVVTRQHPDSRRCWILTLKSEHFACICFSRRVRTPDAAFFACVFAREFYLQFCRASVIRHPASHTQTTMVFMFN